MTIHSTSKPLMSSEDMVGQRTDKGYLVNVNDELIALFKVQGKLYAVKDSCPHAGECTLCYSVIFMYTVYSVNMESRVEGREEGHAQTLVWKMQQGFNSI